jgi:hypothetical protein
MPEESTTFSTTGSVQTFIAGAFIIALLALGMSIYNFSRTTAAVSALLDLQAAAVNPKADADQDEAMSEMQKQLDAIDARVKTLEAGGASASAAP